MEKKKQLPVYEMYFDEQDSKTGDFGVFTVSLVDKPAIIAEYMVFNESGQNHFKFKATDNEKRIVTGAVMIPGMPIYRNDEKRGEFYVVASKDTVQLAAMDFMKNGLTKSVNMMHESNLIPEGVFIFESWVIDRQRGTQEPVGFKQCPEGTWFMSMKIDNQEVWDEFIKTGMLRGFSIEGNFKMKEQPSQDKAVLEALEDILGNRNK
jgi:hypothetical protein